MLNKDDINLSKTIHKEGDEVDAELAALLIKYDNSCIVENKDDYTVWSVATMRAIISASNHYYAYHKIDGLVLLALIYAECNDAEIAKEIISESFEMIGIK